MADQPNGSLNNNSNQNKSINAAGPPLPAPPPHQEQQQQHPQHQPQVEETHVSEEESQGEREDFPAVTTTIKPASNDEINSLEHGPYAHLARIRRRQELDASNIIPLPPRIIGGVRDQVEKTKQCSCRRFNCLRLYCACFAAGIQCNASCNCLWCFNDFLPEHTMSRKAAVLSTLESNPNAFRPKVPLQLERVFVTGSAFALAFGAATATANSSAITKSKSTNNSPPNVAKPKPPTPPHHDSHVLWSRNEQDDSSSPKKMAASTAMSQPPSHAKKQSEMLLASFSEDLRLGCSCKKSQCLKKYCDCFNSQNACTFRCRCENCQNSKGNPTRQKNVLKERKKAERITKGLSSSSKLHPQNPPRQQSGPNPELPMPSSTTTTTTTTKTTKTTTTPTTAGKGIMGGKVVASSSKNTATKSPDKGDEAARGDSHTADSPFWPPSFYADPMKLGGRVPFAALAFGKSRRNESLVVGTGQKPTIRNSTPQRPITAPPPSVFHSNVERENDGDAWTVLERRWKRQLTTLRETFDGIRSALFQPPCKKQRQDPFSALDDDVIAHSFSASILESVACDLSSVLDSVRAAEGAFRDPLFIEDVNKEDELLQQNDEDDEAMAFLVCTEVLETTAESGMPMDVPVDLDEEEPLWCHEELPVDDYRDDEHWIGDYTTPLQKKFSVDDEVNEDEDADAASLLECTETLEERLPTSDEDGASRREQAVQVAQDVVLIQELTRLVRQKTLELTRMRMASASK